MFTNLFRSLITNGYIRAQILGVVRNLALMAGSALVADGLTSSGGAESLVGFAVALVSMGFSAYDKYVVKQKIFAAIAAPAGTPASVIDAVKTSP